MIFSIYARVPAIPARCVEMMAQIAGYEIGVDVNPAFVRANEVRGLEGDNARPSARVSASYRLTRCAGCIRLDPLPPCPRFCE